MKTIFFYLFILFSYCATHAQVTKNTIIIAFNKATDSIITVNDKATYIWINNNLYDEEIKEYTNFTEKSKKEKKSEKYTVRAKSINFLKPEKFYKYFVVADSITRTDCNALFRMNLYDRKKLKTLSPAKNNIYVIYEDLADKHCYNVSFYENVTE